MLNYAEKVKTLINDEETENNSLAKNHLVLINQGLTQKISSNQIEL